jgi:hypothetical protein
MFMDAETGGSVWDLYLEFIEGERGLFGGAQFNPDVFGEETIFAALKDLWRLIEEATKHPGKRVKELLPQ